MYVVRPATTSDLKSFNTFASRAFLGMQSLPKDPERMKDKLQRSSNSFAADVTDYDNEIYYFILEDSETKEAAGCCGIYAKTGVLLPAYFYLIDKTDTQEKDLPTPKTTTLLHPVEVVNGPSEVCALFLLQEYRSEDLGDLISLSRYLYIANNPQRVGPLTTARLRGFINRSTRTSPFWEGLGRHFLDLTFEQVEKLLEEDPGFIPQFLPKYPIYTSILTKQAQYVIQKTHKNTKPAVKMLKSEGYQMTPYIDIFDAGPVMAAKTEQIRTVRLSKLGTLEKSVNEVIDSPQYLISNTALDFRCCYGRLKKTENGGIIIEDPVAKALNLEDGDGLRYVKRKK